MSVVAVTTMSAGLQAPTAPVAVLLADAVAPAVLLVVVAPGVVAPDMLGEALGEAEVAASSPPSVSAPMPSTMRATRSNSATRASARRFQ